MARIQGKISRIKVYEEDGRTDYFMAMSKICWVGICILIPISLYRLLSTLFSPLFAFATLIVLFVIVRLIGPMNLVMLDELLCRIFPRLRTATRLGRIPVYDFRLMPNSGPEVACIMRGPLSGSEPLSGDNVTLNGGYIAGTFFVSNGVIENTNVILFRKTNYSNYIFLSTLLLLGIFAIYLTGYLDECLYPFLTEIIQPMLAAIGEGI